MTFLNGLLAFGALAAVVPLAIHLLNRSRFNRVDWGAMHLLESVVRTNQRRFRLDQLLLLVVRCAIPVLIAMCLARPVLTGSRQLRGDAPQSLLIVLDDTYSMQTLDGAGSRFDAAIAEIEQVVGNLARSSDINVLLAGGTPRPLFEESVRDREAVLSRLRSTEPSFDRLNVTQVLDEAASLVATMDHTSREVLLVGDFQSRDWAGSDERRFTDFRRRLTEAPIPVDATLLPIGRQQEDNRSIRLTDVPEGNVVVGDRVTFRAEVRNFSEAPVRDARVLMTVDGKPAGDTVVSIDPFGQTQVVFETVAAKAASQEVILRLADDDSLPADSIAVASMTASPPISVLLVDGTNSGKRNAALKPTDYLALALTPHLFGLGDRADLSTQVDQFETATVPSRQFSGTELGEASVVVLCGVRSPSEEMVSQLERFVSDGGGLVVCPADSVNADALNSRLYRDGASLLPMRFVERSESAEGASVHVVDDQFEIPALQLFNSAASGRLSSAIIHRWFEIEPGAPGTADGSGTVGASLSTGTPFLCVRRYGEGQVAQLAVALDDEWTDLMLRPFFVPFVQELVRSLTTRAASVRNAATGSTFVIPDFFAREETAGDQVRMSMRLPHGNQKQINSIRREGEETFLFSDTAQPGIYQLSTSTGEREVFASLPDRRESLPQTLDAAELEGVAAKIGASIVESFDEYRAQAVVRSRGRPLWRIVLIGLLALLVLEVWLQSYFSRAPDSRGRP